MEQEIFSRKDFTNDYCRLPLSYPAIFLKKILSYLMEKKGKPFELAVDVACGTGRSTRVLAPYFDKVIGVDLSESQINEAQACPTPDNVSYVICPAELMKLEDNSVDLVTAIWAIHWLEVKTFLQEVKRVLKPRGCVAIFTLVPVFEIHYNDCAEKLTTILKEAFDILLNYVDEKMKECVVNQYKDVFQAVPFVEKERVTDLVITYKMSAGDIIKFIKAMAMYHIFKQKCPKLAEEFIQNIEQRFRDVLKESFDDAKMDVSALHAYIVACKENPESLPK